MQTDTDTGRQPANGPRGWWARGRGAARLIATPLRAVALPRARQPALGDAHAAGARRGRLGRDRRRAHADAAARARLAAAPRRPVRLGRRPDRRHAPHAHLLDLVGARSRDDGCITITVKATRAAACRRHLVRALQPGAYLPLGLPQGDFVLPEPTPRAPAVHHRRQRHHAGDEHAAQPRARGAMPRRRARALRADARRRDLRRRAGGSSRRRTRATGWYPSTRAPRAAVRGGTSRRGSSSRLCPDWRARDVWACGPQALLDALEAHWDAAGLARALHVERFPAALAAPPADAAGGTRALRRAADATSTADGAHAPAARRRRRGLNPPHGCRMGICHSCDVDAAVGLRARPAHRRACITSPGSEVQLCVCAAAGDVELDALIACANRRGARRCTPPHAPSAQRGRRSRSSAASSTRSATRSWRPRRARPRATSAA